MVFIINDLITLIYIPTPHQSFHWLSAFIRMFAIKNAYKLRLNELKSPSMFGFGRRGAYAMDNVKSALTPTEVPVSLCPNTPLEIQKAIYQQTDNMNLYGESN